VSDIQYDVVIIGSGPGGYVAAVRAGQLGLKAAMVESGALGGVCLNVGCIPTKALLHSADLLEEFKESKRFGITTADVTFDLAGAMKHKQTVVRQSTQGVAFLMKKNKVDVYEGWGRLASKNSVHVQLNKGGEETLNAKHIVIATGAKPRTLPGVEFDEDRILSSTGVLELQQTPKSLLVVGAGAIGVEFASMFRSFGSEVTLVEALPRIVPLEDEEISAELTKVFKGRGINIMAGAKFNGVEHHADHVVVNVTDKDDKAHQINVERMLLGIGITPRTNDIGLDALGIGIDRRGFIEVDKGTLRTSIDTIYAIGDCINTPWLAHVASAEGIMVIEQIAGLHTQPINYDKIPACTYCNPEIASVGMTEAQAKEKGFDVKVGKFPFSANGKARILGQNRNGFVKIVAEQKYDELLGVHMIGPGVTELISEGGMALSHEATGESMMHTIHAHPTLYEAIGEAAHAVATGAAIHI
jgi:dihydrolipoamide dehydrogenase